MRGREPTRKGEASLQACPRPWLIGVLHLPALPGAPGFDEPVGSVRTRAADDARMLERCGFTAVIIENFHDAPFRAERVDPETVAAMAVVVAEVVDAVSIPVGVNVLRNDALAALGVAVAAGADFLRVNVLCGEAATDQGRVVGRADELLRRRAALGSDVSILADVDVKHATALDTRPLAVRARDLVSRGGAEAVLVTGDATGQAADLGTLDAVADAVAPAPVLAASGTDAGSVAETLRHCHGAIVGTALKDPGTGRPCGDRAAAYVRAARGSNPRTP